MCCLRQLVVVIANRQRLQGKEIWNFNRIYFLLTMYYRLRNDRFWSTDNEILGGESCQPDLNSVFSGNNHNYASR